MHNLQGISMAQFNHRWRGNSISSPGGGLCGEWHSRVNMHTCEAQLPSEHSFSSSHVLRAQSMAGASLQEVPLEFVCLQEWMIHSEMQRTNKNEIQGDLF